MKKLLYASYAVALLGFYGCSKSGGSGSGGSGPVPAGVTPKVVVAKSTVIADGYDVTSISVINTANNADITADCSVRINGTAASTQFGTETPGTYTVSAKYKGTTDAIVGTITAIDKGPSKYSSKVLVEDYTGAWCGYCPRVAGKLDQAMAANPNILAIAVHNGDPMSYVYEAQMRAKYGVTGFPTAIVNRSSEWNESSFTLNPLTTNWAILGMAIESSISGTTITGKIKTEYNVTTTLPMTITIMLLQDGIVYPQRNYYNTTTSSPYYNLGDPISNYVHNNTLRAASTDIFGDVIPSSDQRKGNVYEKSFSFNASSYNIARCKILAIVSWGEGLGSRKGVINAQIVKAGDNKGFD
jgi:thiol-disulfide isomerase/thioredoxin